MERYVFSGSLTDNMVDFLLDLPNFEPLDLLTTQIDWSSALKNIERRWEPRETLDVDPETGERKKVPFGRWFLLDSGAFSIHTGKAKFTEQDYIDRVNEVADKIDVCAQLDRIPGTFGVPKTPHDYDVSAEESWEQFLRMRSKIKKPEVVMPVSHFGEDIKYLKRMLEWKDEDGQPLHYVGISPANDASKEERMIYLDQVFDTIRASSNPNVKTHIYGFVSGDAMKSFPGTTADAVSYRLIAGYNKIYSREFGVISMSRRPRTSKVQSNLSFLETADEYNLSKLRNELEGLGITAEKCAKYCGHTVDEAREAMYGRFDENDILDWISYDNVVRTVINIKNIQISMRNEWVYHPKNRIRKRSLFQLPS